MKVFVEFSLIFFLVFGISILMRLLKQPLIIGYIISGVIAGPYLLGIVGSNPILPVFSEIGISLLLFLVGLHISPEVVREVGKISLVTGIGQIIFTSGIGFLIIYMLGFSTTASVYMAIALTFSSTIIIMKLLSDKGDLDTLYGEISTGFLIIQDLVAVAILMIISSMNSTFLSLVYSITEAFLALALLIPLGHLLLPRMNKYFEESHEFLFVFAIAWALGLAAFFSYIRFSLEVGALIAGIVLSVSKYDKEMIEKLIPLRDFFLISFFVILGSQLVFADVSEYILPIILLSLFVLLGNPLIVMIIMGIFGYDKEVGFKSGMTVAQISEFSLILVALGLKMGHVSTEVLSVVTVIGIVTIFTSTYMIVNSDCIFKKISPCLEIFEKD